MKKLQTEEKYRTTYLSTDFKAYNKQLINKAVR